MDLHETKLVEDKFSICYGHLLLPIKVNKMDLRNPNQNFITVYTAKNTKDYIILFDINANEFSTRHDHETSIVSVYITRKTSCSEAARSTVK